MPKQRSEWTTTQDRAVATTVFGDAVATGENTLTSVSATSRLAEHGNKTKAEGVVTATAIANSDETAFASAGTEVAVSGANRVMLKTKELYVQTDEISYEISQTKFKAVDHENRNTQTAVATDKQVTITEDAKSVVRSKEVLRDDGSISYTSTTKIKHEDRVADDSDLLDFVVGNIATTTFDTQAHGEDGFVGVDAFALTVEDELSQSTIMITSAVG